VPNFQLLTPHEFLSTHGYDIQVVALLEEKFAQHVPELAGVPVLPVSALTGSGTGALMPAVMHAYDIWQQRIPTSRLNRWLEKVRRNCERNGGNPAITERYKYRRAGPSLRRSLDKVRCVGACGNPSLTCVSVPLQYGLLRLMMGMPGAGPGNALGACTKVTHRLVLVSSKSRLSSLMHPVLFCSWWCSTWGPAAPPRSWPKSATSPRWFDVPLVSFCFLLFLLFPWTS